MTREQPMGPFVSRRTRRHARWFVADTVRHSVVALVPIIPLGIAFGWSAVQIVVVAFVAGAVVTMIRGLY